MKISKMNFAPSTMSWMMLCMVLLLTTYGCDKDDDNTPDSPHNPELKIATMTSGLTGLMGIETDSQGNIWVCESGTATPDSEMNTHNDNGKVIIITANGEKHDAIINLSSFANIHSGELQGTVNLMRDGETMYVLSGDHLYQANISGFKPGDPALDARNIPSENVAEWVSQIPSENNPDHDSHSYNLTKGPDGKLYIADAGANAIIRRNGSNDYSILAEIPAIPNPAFPGMGGPNVQSVPTSILYDGSDFLVTTLTGFPFPTGKSMVYKVSASGNVSVLQDGFTMITDQAEGKGANHLLVQYATSFNPASGFAPNSGALVWADGSTTSVLADGLDQPVGIKQINDHSWYVTSSGDGSVLKVTYE